MLPIALLIVGCTTDTKTSVEDMVMLVDADGDGFISQEDCNDRDASIFPSAQEICDGVDNNCDDEIDEGVKTEFYADVDGDGFGTDNLTVYACEAPEGFVQTGTDCDDASDHSYPGAEELCDGLDNNCDEEIDEGLLQDFFLDADGDGFGDENSIVAACDISLGISSVSGDCNDEDPLQNPLAMEVCDGIDNNCDEEIDEGLLNDFYLDEDEDGYGSEQQVISSCVVPEGYVSQAGDCDDIESFANPSIAEVCDGIDNNCDGSVDESSALDALEYYTDADGDQFGSGTMILGCFVPSGHSVLTGDCDDQNSLVHPSMVEICDGVDNDCDGLSDDATAVDPVIWYGDGDGDGYGFAGDVQSSCQQPLGYVSDNTDCNDVDELISPAAQEVCDGVDNDCDELVDIQDDNVSDAQEWFLDHDQDGFGDAALILYACEQPEQYVSNDEDCDDLDSAQAPGLPEYCNNEDDNCDGSVDELALDGELWYLDADEDGFGLSSDVQMSCLQPTGYVLDDSDCVDTNDSISPLGTEICDGVDNDCDGLVDNGSGLIGTQSQCAAQSCLDVLEQNISAVDGVYWIDPLNTGSFSVYCDMSTSGGGWTLLLKSSGDSYLNYENPLWTDSNLYNESSVDTSSSNAKFSSFLQLDIREMMGCFPTQGNHCIFAEFGNQTTAQEIFTGGSQQMGAGWNNQSYSGWSWQPNCHYLGINTPYCYRRARFGFTANQENDCSSNDTAIGFGLASCGANSSENLGSGNLCLSSGCTQGIVNTGFMGLLYGR